MGHTIVEKILAAHAGIAECKPGDFLVADIDFAMLTDARAPGAMKAMGQIPEAPLRFAPKTALILDHFSPPPHKEAAQIHATLRDFAQQTGATIYDIGEGICHQLLPEKGHLTCGDLVVGTDSHSVTYGAFNALGMGVEGTDLTAAMAYGKQWFQVPPTVKVTLDGALMPGVWAKDVTLYMLGKLGAEGANYQAIEYVGSAVDAMDIDDRMTLCNHAAELGAKAALLEADSKTLQWLAEHNASPPKPVAADRSAQYLDQFSINTAQLTPQLARRHEVDDIVGVTEAAGQKIQVALIGTCTNGRLDDIRQVAAVLKGHRLAPGVRLIVTPASRAIYLKAAQEGLIETIVAAGGSFESAGCGTCISVTGHFTPGDNETIISSANRNFKGRLGNDHADIWLGSAATVAASALRGVITDPRQIDHVNWSQL